MAKLSWNGWIACLVLLGAVSCTDSGRLGQSDQLAGINQAPVLPNPSAIRVARDIVENEIAGSEYLLKSDAATVEGANLVLPPNIPGMEFGVYALALQAGAIESLRVNLYVMDGNEVWLGLADYTRDTWSYSAPVTTSTTLILNPAKHLSPTNYVLCAVITCQGNQAKVLGLSLRSNVPNQAPTVDLIATPPEGDAPLSVNFTADAADADGTIVNYEWEFDGDGTFEEQSLNGTGQHDYPDPSKQTVTVRVTDDDGAQGIDQLEIRAHGWIRVAVDTYNQAGASPRIAEIDGCPAISYYDWGRNNVMYIRASTPTGAAKLDWSGAIIVHFDANVSGNSISLDTIAGYPAISYVDNDTWDLCYARAKSATGLTGGAWDKVTVDSLGKTGSANSLAIVDGHPAISYGDSDDRFLKYAWSNTETGTAAGDWQTITVDENGGGSTSLAVVGGCPAIAFYYVQPPGICQLRYAQASTANGANPADWSCITLDGVVVLGMCPSLAVVGGYPMISFCEPRDTELWIARSASVDGGQSTDWSFSVVDNSCWAGFLNDLIDYHGKPAVCYRDETHGYCKIGLSSTPDGADQADWTITSTDEPGLSVEGLSMAEVDGNIAVTYLQDCLWYAMYF